MRNQGSPRGAPPPQSKEFGGSQSLEEGALDTSQSVESLPARVTRYGKARGRADAMLAYLRDTDKPRVVEHHRYRAADRLMHCGQYLHFRHYTQPDLVRLHSASFCKQHLICPLCAIRRGAKAVQSYLERFQLILSEPSGAALRPYVVTYTVKNGRDLAERMEHLRAGLKALRDRRQKARSRQRGHHSTWADIAGAVAALEVTYSAKHGWHPHMHMLALCEADLNPYAMSAEWRKITGDSFIIDARPMYGDPVEAFCEVFKYAVKFSGLPPERCWEAAQTLRGQRLLFSLGNFRGVDIPETLTDDPLSGPYVDFFYRYLGSGRYGLKA